MHVILDARILGEKESAHSYLKRIFCFPDHYGNNLDALYDCLSELPYGANLSIHLIHTEDAGDYFPKVLTVLEDLPGAEILLTDEQL